MNYEALHKLTRCPLCQHQINEMGFGFDLVKYCPECRWVSTRLRTKDQMKTTKQAADDLLVGLVYIHGLLITAKEQNPSGTVGLGAVSKNPDGSGRISGTFDAKEFLDDVGALARTYAFNHEETSLRQQVREFMNAIGQEVKETPEIPPEKVVHLRLRLIMEEAFEVLASCFHVSTKVPEDDIERVYNISRRIDELKTKTLAVASLSPVSVNLPELADALGDLDYVVEGTRLAMGIDGEPIADAIQEANMKKLTGPKNEFGKQMKPEGWQPPDIAKCLKDQGWEDAQ